MPAESHQPILQLVGVSKVYGTAANPLEVLHGVDFTVERGEYVAIVGPSGAGKSTLLNILGCLDRPSAGAYRLLGENVATFDDRRLSHVRRTRIGFVFQSFQLVSHLTVQENVEMPLFYDRQSPRRRRSRAKELIAQVGLGHRTGHRPSQLSGGENQRVAIARALANEPAMILADEPTGNLDTATGHEILSIFGALHEAGRTIVMITHDPSIAEAASRRVVLRDGRIEQELTYVPA